jgi:hypothetical protein
MMSKKQLFISIFTAVIFVASAHATEYQLSYSDSANDSWVVKFDGTNEGLYIDNITNASMTFDGLAVGPVFLGHYTDTATTIADGAEIGYTEQYSNFIIDTSAALQGGSAYLSGQANIASFPLIANTQAFFQYPDGNHHASAASYDDVPEIYSQAFNTLKGVSVNDNYTSETYYSTQTTYSVTSVPLPSAFALMSLGLAGFGLARRRKA